MSLTIQTIYGTLDEKQLKELKGAISEANEMMYQVDQKKRMLKEIGIILGKDNTKNYVFTFKLHSCKTKTNHAINY